MDAKVKIQHDLNYQERRHGLALLKVLVSKYPKDAQRMLEERKAALSATVRTTIPQISSVECRLAGEVPTNITLGLSMQEYMKRLSDE